MKSFLFVLLGLAATASGASLYDSPSSGSDGYGGQPEPAYGGSEPGYGGGMERVCKPYTDTQMIDHCEPYSERVCRTFQKEHCHDVSDKNCRPMVTSRQVRKCFNVTELLCSLKEDVKYEVVQVASTVQKCHKVQERVCDTVYETQMSSRDDFQCREMTNPECSNKEQTLYDQTCKTTVSFECEMQQVGGGGYGSSSSSSGADSYGSGGDSYGSSSGGDSYGSDDSYGQSKPVCRRKSDTKCYKTPRSVNIQVCHSKTEKVCEKLQEMSPYPQEKQNCHNEDKKVCELEQRTQPKQVKKYVYRKECRSVPRKVCANSDVKSMVPSCVSSSRQQCSYTPVEQCDDIQKQHCMKLGKQVRKERCEMVPKPSGYAAPAPSYGGSSEPSYAAPAPSYGGSSEPSYGGSEPSYGGSSGGGSSGY